MLPDANNELIKLEEIASKLKVEFPHTVGCKIDELNRMAVVDRMELSLEGDLSIPAGWRGIICMISGIDRRFTLYDGIVLPAIVPGRKTPIGPYLVENVSNDFFSSRDNWELEFRIVDTYGNEKPLHKAPVTHRTPSDVERQSTELKESYEHKLAEKDKAYEEKQNEVIQKTRKYSELQTEYNDLQAAMGSINGELRQKTEEFEKKLAEKEIALRESSERIIKNAEFITDLQKKGEVLQVERDELKNERDRAIRLAEDQKSRIEGLEAQLKAKESVDIQRKAEMEEETANFRRLEKEMQKIEEMLAERDKIVNELNDKLNLAEAQRAETQTELDKLREGSRQTIIEHDRIERDRDIRIKVYVDQVEMLEKELEVKKFELTDREDKLASRNVKLNEMTVQLEKLQEDIGRLKDERNYATRLAEEQSSRIQGLETEFEALRKLHAQRTQQLEVETVRGRTLERELEQIKEVQTRHEKTIEQQETKIIRLSDERDQLEMKALQFRTQRNSLENDFSTQKATITRLEEKLTTAQEQVEDFETKLGQAKVDLTKLESKFEKRVGGQMMYERYELIRQISQSDTGEAYKVYDKELGRAVMLKILPPAMASDRRALRQLTTEAQLLAKLNHRNTVCLYNFVQIEEPYMVMEYVEGRTLRQVIDAGDLLPLDHVLDIVEQVCRGLSFAHSQDIYHRNLSPEHLILGDDGFIKIMDFGLADTIRTTMVRLTGSIPLAMLNYLSPEQLHGKSKINSRSDIYSLGIVFYEMLSGQPPFTGENVIDQHIKEPPRSIDHVPQEINWILQKCLEKKIEDRYVDSEELRKALLDVKSSISF